MKRKDKMISFRLPAEEYQRLCQIRSVTGVKNVSELARAALNRMLDFPNSDQSELHEKVQELRVKIQGLSSELDRLSRSVPEVAEGHRCEVPARSAASSLPTS